MLIDTLNNIINTNNEDLLNLKYCLVTKDKLPYRVDEILARSNHSEDFVSIQEIISNLENINVENYKGVGISIQASNICAIDVDHCFSSPFDITSGDERAQQLIDKFKDLAYIEFSFSGTGLRILFNSNLIENYSDKYYIKNKNNSIEYYQPNNSYRYVTVTGRFIYNNLIKTIDNNIIIDFLNEYMKKTIKSYDNVITTNEVETRTYEQLMKIVRCKYLKDYNFQDLWFTKAPGSGKDESERDYHLVAYLYENVTQDKNLLKQIFESSDFFKTKDWKHINKWKNQNGRYFNYLYDTIRRNK